MKLERIHQTDTMKLKFRFVACLLLVLAGLTSCTRKEVAPTADPLTGTWLLVHKEAWKKSTGTELSLSSSPQTITFFKSGQFHSTVEGDTALADYRFYTAGYTSLAGPYFITKRSSTDLTGSFHPFYVDGSLLTTSTYIILNQTLSTTRSSASR